ncbi:MAG: DNA-binding transcriptional MerR regulator [Alphaproteobacteria bacterium]|jgi:DNA-binding transcriptional MerR regulator
MLETISFDQLATELDVPRHIIHLWTKKFPILNPQRTQTGKVGFKHRDLALAKGLKCLLIHEKQAIKDVQALLNERGVSHIISIGKDLQYQNKEAAEKILSQTSDSASYTNTQETEPSISMTLKSKSIAKQAFNNINNIFAKDQTKSKTLTKIDPIVSESQKSKTPEDKVSENDLSDIINLPDDNLPDDAGSQETVIGNFEDNWRHLMEKEGKATPIEDAREMPDMPDMVIDPHILSDIWVIDDEIELFDDEPACDTQSILDTALDIKHIEADQVPQILVHQTEYPPMKPKSAITTQSKAKPAKKVSPAKPSFTIEQEEKIQHLIAKLDIMRDEISSASTVMTQTLKAFGFSGFENAYNEFDQKSVY